MQSKRADLKQAGEFGEAEAQNITFKVVKILTHKYKNEIPDIEQIQDLVEESFNKRKLC